MSGDNIQSGDKTEIADASTADVSASIGERIMDNWIPISAFTVLFLAGLVVTDFISWTPPEWLVSLLMASAILFVPFYIVGSVIVAKLVTDNRNVVVEIDAEKFWATRIFLISREAWKNKEVLEGQPYSHGTTDIKFVRSLEQREDGIAVTGPWMGTKTDVELATAQKSIKANRGQLREWAQIGQNLYAGFPAVVQNVTSAVWKKHSDDIMKATEGEQALQIIKSMSVDQAERLTDSIETPDEKNISDLTENEDNENSPENGGGE